MPAIPRVPRSFGVQPEAVPATFTEHRLLPPPGGMGPLPCCAARIGPQGSTRPGRLPPPGHSRSQPGAMPAMHQPDASALRAFTRHCHDAFFRAILSDSERANALIHAHWPKAMRWMLTGEPARPIDPALVHGNLEKLRADKVYLVGGTLDKPNAVAPIEHKSSSDPGTPEPVTAGLRGLQAQYAGKVKPWAVPFVFSTRGLSWNMPGAMDETGSAADIL